LSVEYLNIVVSVKNIKCFETLDQNGFKGVNELKNAKVDDIDREFTTQIFYPLIIQTRIYAGRIYWIGKSGKADR